ncbi:tyrosine-type recombinase/integrase [Primorskyibacter sp. 2E107]|uniref:tyrosine-type recombinase/integrase n=1 Tax=Primorskyibacter sp. 2E107 TaxID=3403458 RepID=UPI003AF901ED
MASIRERTLGDGSKAYLVQITRRKAGVFESRQFDKKKTAETWAKNREREIDEDIKAGRAVRTRKEKRVTLGDAIDRYEKESMQEIGDTKTQVLRTIKTEYDIAELRCDENESKHIVSFVQSLYDRPGLNSPSTAGNYLSHLSSVFAVARPLWGFPLDQQAIKDAHTVCSKMGIVSKSDERSRRHTRDELDRLMDHFQRATLADKRTLPMHIVTAFALFSNRRQAEICRITWADYDPDAQRIMVRGMKNPGKKKGVDTMVELPDPCCVIIAAMPKVDEHIFPFSTDAVSRRFTDACKFLEIDDLRFHDLRHEGASRLAEMGRTVPQLAAVTGHKSWKSLERYTHVRQIGDKYAGWKWIAKVTGEGA